MTCRLREYASPRNECVLKLRILAIRVVLRAGVARPHGAQVVGAVQLFERFRDEDEVAGEPRAPSRAHEDAVRLLAVGQRQTRDDLLRREKGAASSRCSRFSRGERDDAPSFGRRVFFSLS